MKKSKPLLILIGIIAIISVVFIIKARMGNNTFPNTNDDVITSETSDDVITSETSDDVITKKTSDYVITKKISDDEITKKISDYVITSDNVDMFTRETSGYVITRATNDYMYIGNGLMAESNIRFETTYMGNLIDCTKFSIGDILRIDCGFITYSGGFTGGIPHVQEVYNTKNVTNEYYKNKDYKPMDIINAKLDEYDFFDLNARWLYIYNSENNTYASIIEIIEDTDRYYKVIENGKFLKDYSKKVIVTFDNLEYYFLAQDDISAENLLEQIKNNTYAINSDETYYLGKGSGNTCEPSGYEIELKVKVLEVTSFNKLYNESVYSENFKESYNNEYGLYSGHIDKNRGDNCYIVGEIIEENIALNKYSFAFIQKEDAFFSKGDIVFICNSGNRRDDESEVFGREPVGSIYTVHDGIIYPYGRILKPFAILNIN